MAGYVAFAGSERGDTIKMPGVAGRIFAGLFGTLFAAGFAYFALLHEGVSFDGRAGLGTSASLSALVAKIAISGRVI